MKQIKITFLPGKGNPIDIIVNEQELNFTTKVLDDKTDALMTPLGFIICADVASYTVDDYIQPDPGPSPALRGNGGNENILWK